ARSLRACRQDPSNRRAQEHAETAVQASRASPPPSVSRLRDVGRPTRSLDAELLCILAGQSLPAAQLQRVTGDDASDWLTGEEPLEDVEADVPARRTPGDEAAIDVVPERQTRAAAARFELPSQ